MELDTTEDSTYSDYSDGFIVIDDDDDDLEDGLIWDSDESRPPGPSPPSSANMNDSPAVDLSLRRRSRRHQLRRVYVEPETQSDSESLPPSQVSTDSNPPSPTASTILIPDDSDALSDRTVSDFQPEDDETQPVFEPHSPSQSPPPNDNPHPAPTLDPGGDRGNSPIHPISPDPPPPLNTRADTPIPRSPDYPPPELEDQEREIQLVEEVAIAQNPPTETPPPEFSKPQIVASEPSALMNTSTLSESDEGSLCSICMDPLTNSGKHRVVCLRCGHVFGQSCVERWIKIGCNNGARRCPTCNKKACLKDIRVLYLPKVVPLDTVEKDRLIQEKEVIASQKTAVEMELTRCRLQNELNVKQYEDRLKRLETKLAEASSIIEMLSEGKKITIPPHLGAVSTREDGVRVELLHLVDISKEGGCRVLAFCPRLQELVVSQPSGNTLFAGFGIRVLNSVDWQPSRFMFLHSKMIRDLTFHAEERGLLLSVSLDQTAKLVDLTSSTVVHTFKSKGPLWSCSWDASNPHQFVVGSQLGIVTQFDKRMMLDQHIWESPNNMTPVVALASAPPSPYTPFPQGGILSCRLNKVYMYARHGESYSDQELPLEGPFMSMRYDAASHSLLTGCRPSTRCLNARVNLHQLTASSKSEVCMQQIHTFNCGTTARVLSRLTTLPATDDTLVAAHHESGRCVNIWSCKSGSPLYSFTIKEPVIDMSCMTFSSKCLLATLSEKKVGVYKVTT